MKILLILGKVMLCLYFFSVIFGFLHVLVVGFGPEVFGVVYILIVISFGLYLLRLKRLENPDE